jgi:hypothetical protein
LGAHGTLFGRLGNVGTGPAPDFAINADGSGLKITADQQTGAQAWPFYVECEASWTDSANNPESAVGYAQESITVTSVKWWDVGYPIGVDMQQTQNPDGTTTTTTTPNGQMTAPQDQTGSSPVPLNVYAMPNQALTCSVTPATDWDHWAMTGINWPTDSGYVADSVTSYAWSCSGGAITTSNGATVWTAPSAAGTYTITCTMDDMPAAVVAPDRGTRDDVALVRSVSVIVPNYTLGVRLGGTNDAFSSTCNVAASVGDWSTSDIQILATDGNGNPVAGAPAPVLNVDNGSVATGVFHAASAVCAAGSDAAGYIMGTYQASDISGSVIISIAPGGSTASVSQHWNDVGAVPTCASETAFYGIPVDIDYKMAFNDSDERKERPDRNG